MCVLHSSEDDYIGENELWGDDNDKEDKTRRSRARTSSRGMGVKRNRFARFSGHAIGSSSLRKVESNGKASETKIFCHEANYLEVPTYPVPRSWLKNIQMYSANDNLKGYFYTEQNILAMRKKNDFLLVIIVRKNIKRY